MTADPPLEDPGLHVSPTLVADVIEGLFANDIGASGTY